MLPSTCMVMSSSTPTWVYWWKTGIQQDYIETKLCVCVLCVLVHHLVVFITPVILISSVGRLVWGRCREASRQKYVRRRERQNVTVGGQPAAPLEPFRSEVLVVEVLGHFLQVLHVGSVGWWKWQSCWWGGCKPLFNTGSAWSALRWKQIYWSWISRSRSTPLTSALSAASGSHYAPGSPPPPLPRGTDGPSPSSPWPRSAGWIPPLQMGYWSEKDGLKWCSFKQFLLYPVENFTQLWEITFRILVCSLKSSSSSDSASGRW